MNMSEPIDFIDLTVDSPIRNQPNGLVSSRNKNRDINIENIPDNGIRTTTQRKQRRRYMLKEQPTQVCGITIEITSENVLSNVQPTEIIEIDAINTPPKEKTYCINDSAEGDVFTLTCPICYEKLSSKLKPMSTRCGHIFCSQCLKLATNMSKKCPTCKKAVKFQNCTRLYF